MCLCPLESKHKVKEVTTVTHEITEVAILSNTRRSSPLSDKGSPRMQILCLSLVWFPPVSLVPEVVASMFSQHQLSPQRARTGEFLFNKEPLRGHE